MGEAVDVTKLEARLARTRAGWHSLIEPLSEEDAARKTSAVKWSAAEIGTHLVMTEEIVILTAEKLFADPSVAPRAAGLRLRRLGLLMMPFRFIHAPAPKVVRPKAVLSVAETLRRSKSSRERLLTNLRFVAGQPTLHSVVAPHPFFGPLTFLEWCGVLASHEARHTRQLAEIVRAPGVSLKRE